VRTKSGSRGLGASFGQGRPIATASGRKNAARLIFLQTSLTDVICVDNNMFWFSANNHIGGDSGKPQVLNHGVVRNEERV